MYSLQGLPRRVGCKRKKDLYLQEAIGEFMRKYTILPAILAFAAMPLIATSQETVKETQEPVKVNQALDKIVAQEAAEMNMIRKYSPLVETYIQTVRPDKALGSVPDGDRYFLGRAELDKGV
jgi:hypothetical protein